MRNKVALAMACFVFTGLLFGLGSAGWATTTVDGVTLLTQPPNSCTGFPLKLTKTGSYRLVSNLTVSCPNKDAIDVSAGHLVTIDLNGFSIIGPGSGTGVGIKVTTGAGSLVVHNGAVTAMGGEGISASDCKVEEVHLLFNAGFAIDCIDGVILNNTVVGNGAGSTTDLGVVQGNKVVDNQFEGIRISSGLVQNNEVDGNGGGVFSPNFAPAIAVNGTAMVSENNVFGNGGNGVNVTGDGSKVGENSVVDNSGEGINATGGFGDNIFANAVADNGGVGIDCKSSGDSAVTSNVLYNNDGNTTDSCTAGTTQVHNCVSVGNNVCNGSKS